MQSARALTWQSRHSLDTRREREREQGQGLEDKGTSIEYTMEDSTGSTIVAPTKQ